MQNFIFLVAPRCIQLDLHTDELLMFQMMQNHNRPPFMYEVQWVVDTDKTIALHPSMLLVAVGGSQWAYLRIATSNHTATRHHFVAIVLFDFSFNQYTSSSWNLKGKLWETTQRFAWKKKILPPIVNTSPSGFVLFFKTKKTAGEAPTVKFVLKKGKKAVQET